MSGDGERDAYGAFMRRIERLARQLISGEYPGGAQFLWDFQLKLLKLQREIQTEIKSTSKLPRSKDRTMELERLKWARWQSRLVGDSLAWLLLGLDDQTIVPLGDNAKGSIAPDSIGMQGVLAIAQTLGSNGAGMPILNDITDCLRIGDITFVKPTDDRQRDLTVVEVKTRLLSEQVDADGKTSMNLSASVHSISRNDQMFQASQRIPKGDAHAELTVWRDDRRITRQVNRMKRATARQGLAPNAVGDVDGEQFISLEMQIDAPTHIEVLRRVLRRARRSGVAVEAADDAFVYLAMYHPTDLTKAVQTGMTRSAGKDLRRFLPPSEERDARDIVVVNAVLPYDERKWAIPWLPYFLAPIPKATIFDLMNRRMALIVIANPGWIARALEAEGFHVETHKRGRTMPRFDVSFQFETEPGSGYRVQCPAFDNDLWETMANFRRAETVVKKYAWQREKLSELIPEGMERRRAAARDRAVPTQETDSHGVADILPPVSEVIECAEGRVAAGPH